MPKAKLVQPWPSVDQPRWVTPTEVDRFIGWSAEHRRRQRNAPPFYMFGLVLLRSWSGWWWLYSAAITGRIPMPTEWVLPEPVTGAIVPMRPAPVLAPAPEPPVPPRRRGRPRKVAPVTVQEIAPPIRRKRGRPPKVKPVLIGEVPAE